LHLQFENQRHLAAPLVSSPGPPQPFTLPSRTDGPPQKQKQNANFVGSAVAVATRYLYVALGAYLGLLSGAFWAAAGAPYAMFNGTQCARPHHLDLDYPKPNISATDPSTFCAPRGHHQAPPPTPLQQ
jgi:hypothetical protein